MKKPLDLPSESVEFEFSSKLQRKLAQEYREKEERDGRRKALKDSTGINDDVLLDKLTALEFNGEDIVALNLMPLVEVAWADGSVTERERADVLSAAVSLGLDSQSPGYKLLESWLQSKPKPFDEFRKAWRNYVRSLQMDPNIKQALKADILRRARSKAEILGAARHVAEVDGSWYRKVSRAQEIVLEAVADAFDDK